MNDNKCFYCGTPIEAGLLYNVCDECDTRNLFSDLYKDENGFRPTLSQWTLAEMKVYMKNWGAK